MPDDMASTPAAIGHNSGEPKPLIDASGLLDELQMRFVARKDRGAALAAAITRWCEKFTTASGEIVIPDDDGQAKSTDFARQIKVEIDAIEAARKATKESVLEAGRVIDGFFNATLAGPLVIGANAIRKAMTAYAVKKADEEAAARRAEAQRLAEEAARKAVEAEATRSDAAMHDALVTEQRAIDTAAEAQAPRAGMAAAAIKTDMGGSAGLRGTWKHRIIAEAKVPKKFLMVNDAAIKAEIKAKTRDGECSAAIPGIEIYLERSITVR